LHVTAGKRDKKGGARFPRKRIRSYRKLNIRRGRPCLGVGRKPSKRAGLQTGNWIDPIRTFASRERGGSCLQG